MKKSAFWLAASVICLALAIPVHAESPAASGVGAAVGTTIASGIQPMMDGSSEAADYDTVTGPSVGKSVYLTQTATADGNAARGDGAAPGNAAGDGAARGDAAGDGAARGGAALTDNARGGTARGHAAHGGTRDLADTSDAPFQRSAGGLPPSAGIPPTAPGYALTGLYGPTGNAKVTYPHRASIYSLPRATAAADDGFDWDWLGWLGLVGLAGVFGRIGQGER